MQVMARQHMQSTARCSKKAARSWMTWTPRCPCRPSSTRSTSLTLFRWPFPTDFANLSRTCLYCGPWPLPCAHMVHLAPPQCLMQVTPESLCMYVSLMSQLRQTVAAAIDAKKNSARCSASWHAMRLSAQHHSMPCGSVLSIIEGGCPGMAVGHRTWTKQAAPCSNVLRCGCAPMCSDVVVL